MDTVNLTTSRQRMRFGMRRKVLNALILLLCTAGSAVALPTAPQVVSGSATFTTNGSALTVTNSANAIINWNSFSINSGELTRFLQPSAASAVLNRVVGSDPSRIFGALQSNGKVFLINQNGILFGPGAKVDVNGLIASTLNISNEDFLAGRMKFTMGALAGAVENQGEITTPSGGSVYLIAPNVNNSGIIKAPNGDILLAAGSEVLVVDKAAPEIAVVVSAPEHQAVNIGQLLADAGRIGVYGGVVRQKGVVSANSAVQDASGRIFLRSTTETSLEAGSVTTADGVGNASGGVIYALSGGLTSVQGSISAKGGESGGDGGFIETSGKRIDVWSASVSTLASKGRTGLWLIDPDDIAISAPSQATAIASTLSSTNLTLTTAACDPAYGTCSTASGGGNITVSTPISWSSANKLTLMAGDNIYIGSNITSTGNGSLDLYAGTGVISVSGGAPISINLGSGSLMATAQSNITLGNATYAASLTAGTIMLNATAGGILLDTGSGLQTVGNGPVQLMGGSPVTISGSINAGAGSVFLRGSQVDFNSSSSVMGAVIRSEATSGAINFNGGTIGGSSAQSIEFSADILTVSGGGTIISTSTASIMNEVHYAPYTGIPINLGSYLPAALLANTTTPTLVIGRESGTGGTPTGNITVGSLNWSSGQRLALLSGGSVTGGGITAQGLGVIAGGAISLTGNNVGKIALQSAGGGVTFGNAAGFYVVSETGGMTDPKTITGVSSNGGAVALTASAGDIWLAAPVNAGGGAVSLDAQAGGIYTAAAGAIDIFAGSVSANAGTNIGGPAYALKTQTPLWTSLTAGGSLYADNVGAVQTGTVVEAISAGSVLKLSAHSPLTIGTGGAIAGGDITLAASPMGGLDDLTINGPVTSLTGNIYLLAGNRIYENALVTAAGTVSRSEFLNGGLVPPSLQPTPPAPPLYGDPATTGGLVLVADSLTSDQNGTNGSQDPDKDKDKDKQTGNAQPSGGDKKDEKPKKNYCN